MRSRSERDSARVENVKVLAESPIPPALGRVGIYEVRQCDAKTDLDLAQVQVRKHLVGHGRCCTLSSFVLLAPANGRIVSLATRVSASVAVRTIRGSDGREPAISTE